MQQLNIGATLQNGKYRIERVLGQGGFGITYLATNMSTGKLYAIKEFFPKNICGRDVFGNITLASESQLPFINKLKDKFLKEANRLHSLSHKNIIRCHETFHENDTVYYSMDYIEGSDLQTIVRQNGKFSLSDAIVVISKIGSALDYIHSKNLTHLDVKPANIMLVKSSGEPILIDFGISKQYDISGDATSTNPIGISKGYAPIEQYSQEGVHSFSPQIDVYSLAATLYFLVTGNTPPEATVIIAAGLPQNNLIPSDLYQIIKKGMNPMVNNRFKSIREFCANLFLVHSETTEETEFIDGSENSDEAHPIVIAGHEARDLGLSVLWATKDIGAFKDNDPGELYLWGDCDGSKTLKVKSSLFARWFKGAPRVNNISGNSAYDTATNLWGGGWRMPTISEIKELFDNSEWMALGNTLKLFGPSGKCINLDSRKHWTAESPNGRLMTFYWLIAQDELGVNLSQPQKDWSECYCPIRPVIDRKYIKTSK